MTDTDPPIGPDYPSPEPPSPRIEELLAIASAYEEMSDAQLLAEVKAAGIDASAEAQRLRETLLTALENARRKAPTHPNVQLFTQHAIESCRRVVSRFLALPYRHQITASKALGLYRDEDRALSDEALALAVFKRAADAALLERLLAETERLHGASAPGSALPLDLLGIVSPEDSYDTAATIVPEAPPLDVSVDHEDVATAFARARELGKFPDEFFEALSAPLEGE